MLPILRSVREYFRARHEMRKAIRWLNTGVLVFESFESGKVRMVSQDVALTTLDIPLPISKEPRHGISR
jgi:hypothetical protein